MHVSMMAGTISLVYFSALLDNIYYVFSRHLLLEESTLILDVVVIWIWRVNEESGMPFSQYTTSGMYLEFVKSGEKNGEHKLKIIILQNLNLKIDD